MKIHPTAGALGNGERIFITAKLPDYIRVGKDDLIEKYLFLNTSHDGYGSIEAAFTPIRIVCNNTLNVALQNCSNSIKIRHTQSAESRLKEAHKVMGISNMLATQLEAIFNQWTRVHITDREVQKLIQLAMVPNREVLRNVQGGNMDALSATMCMNMQWPARYSRRIPQRVLCSGPTTLLLGTFKMSVLTRTRRPNSNPLWMERESYGHRLLLICVLTLQNLAK